MLLSSLAVVIACSSWIFATTTSIRVGFRLVTKQIVGQAWHCKSVEFVHMHAAAIMRESGRAHIFLHCELLKRHMKLNGLVLFDVMLTL